MKRQILAVATAVLLTSVSLSASAAESGRSRSRDERPAVRAGVRERVLKTVERVKSLIGIRTADEYPQIPRP